MRHGRRPTLTMNHARTPPRTLRLTMLLGAAAAFLLLPTRLRAQTRSPIPAQVPAQVPSSLPATPPTSLATPSSPPTPAVADTLPHHKAHVTYADGLLGVQADNSSLNQILRDISHATGMIIVGGVADQRIFGNYGPGSPSTILQTLLDGTGANMLLRETASHGLAELVLSPQTAGAVPPGPNSSIYDATENEPEIPSLAAAVQPRPQEATSRAPAGSQAPPSKSPNSASSPHTAKTPQQIYEELQELQKRQSAATQGQPSAH